MFVLSFKNFFDNNLCTNTLLLVGKWYTRVKIDVAQICVCHVLGCKKKLKKNIWCVSYMMLWVQFAAKNDIVLSTKLILVDSLWFFYDWIFEYDRDLKFEFDCISDAEVVHWK